MHAAGECQGCPRIFTKIFIKSLAIFYNLPYLASLAGMLSRILGGRTELRDMLLKKLYFYILGYDFNVSAETDSTLSTPVYTAIA
jgi:hypothetical protein